MSNLPPRPDSPPRERIDSRYSTDDRDRRPVRPMALQPSQRYRGDWNDRDYAPRSRGSDSYVAPSYDSRRESDTRRREYDERDRDGDRDRDRIGWQRSRDLRERERGPKYEPEYDRYRRSTGRERSTERGRARYPSRDRYRESYDYPSRRYMRSPSPRQEGHRRSRSPSPRRDTHRRSRSTSSRRRPHASPYHGRALSPPHSRSSPPSKRMRLGNHSIDISPHRVHEHRSPSHPPHPTDPVPQSYEQGHGSPRRSRAGSPFRIKRESTPPFTTGIKSEEQSFSLTEPRQELANAREKLLGHENPRLTSLLPGEPRIDRQEKLKNVPKPEGALRPSSDLKMRERSASPPKEPRVKVAPPPTPTLHPRSPPRGPRNHARGATPTGPASLHPPGSRGQRRPYPAIPTVYAASMHSASGSPTALVDVRSVPTPPVSDPDPKVPLPIIPSWKGRPSITRESDLEITRLQGHRAHLVTEYAIISKSTRRAMHELEMATIDLRAAETRRRIADSQMEKARAGVLGIDAAQIELPVV